MVNTIGCLLMGMLICILSQPTYESSAWRLLLTIGFCGGFTTFSAFAADNLKLIHSGQTGLAIVYVFLSFLVCMLAVWLGYVLGQLIVKG